MMRRAGFIRQVGSAVIVVVVACCLLVLLWPSLFGLEHVFGVAQAISVRAAGAVIAGIAVIALLLAALAIRAVRRLAASLALLFLVFALLSAGILADRGFGDIAFETPGETDVTVLSWNTLGNAPGADAVADIILREGVDVVALPETTEEFGDAIADELRAAGVEMQVLGVHFDLISRARSTTLLVAASLGEYAIDEDAGSTGRLPTVIAKPVDGDGPTLIAAHPVAPVPGYFETWASDLEFLAGACVGDDVIMAGDFNATIDHFARLPHADGATLGDCADAGVASGNGAVGTWPTAIPALLGTPIDHVMATDDWRVTGMQVIQSLDTAGSDHRPILVQLSPSDGRATSRPG